MRQKTAYVWDDAAIERLQSLWAEGLSASIIGERMGVSKNSIIGKAHRLDLSKRPDPVKKLSSEGPRKIKRPFRLRENTLPPLPAVVAYEPPPKPVIEAPRPVAHPVEDLRVVDDAPVIPFLAPVVQSHGRGCLFPLGERLPRGGFLECGAVLATTSYCNHHAAICYTTYRSAA
jgi:GcrA cell cycle regulator